jgi:hypothetical protein
MDNFSDSVLRKYLGLPPPRHYGRNVYEVDLQKSLLDQVKNGRGLSFKINFRDFTIAMSQFMREIFAAILKTRRITIVEFDGLEKCGVDLELFAHFVTQHKQLVRFTMRMGKSEEPLDYYDRHWTEISRGARISFNRNFSALAVALSLNPTLRSLCLNNVGLRLENLAHIHHIILSTPKLQILELRENDLDDTSIVSISEVLADSTSIRFVDFGLNPISDNAYSWCMNIWQRNYTVCSLKIHHPGVWGVIRGYTSTVLTLENYIERNRSLLWHNVHSQLVEFYLALAPLGLPTYIMLWIFDWLSPMTIAPEHNHVRKIRLLEGLVVSRRKMLSMRNAIMSE